MRLQHPIPKVTENDYIRFWSKAILTANQDICWEWQYGTNRGGYGIFDLRGESFVAHRVSYFICNNIDPIGLCVCHTCDNPRCVNPTHLFLGTDKDNIHDMMSKGRANGHTGDNFKDSRSHKGEKHHHSKLTDQQIISIRKTYSESKITLKEIAKDYKVHFATIGKIINHQAWKHVTENV